MYELQNIIMVCCCSRADLRGGGGISCSLFEQDASLNPTNPASTVEYTSNFYASRGISDQFGIYKGIEHFVINIPTPGDYMLEYTTKYGTFQLIFRVSKTSLLYIGLNSGDEVLEAALATGTIPDTAFNTVQAVTVFGDIQVVFGPFSPGQCTQFFTLNPLVTAIIFIQGGNVMTNGAVVELSREAVHGPGCRGVSLAGYCWYLSADEQSCNAFCASHGGVNLNGLAYAGSQGSASRCNQILNALGAPADNIDGAVGELDLSAAPEYTRTGCAVLDVEAAGGPVGKWYRSINYPAHPDGRGEWPNPASYQACACNN